MSNTSGSASTAPANHFTVEMSPGATVLDRVNGKWVLSLLRHGLMQVGDKVTGDPVTIPGPKTLSVASTGGFKECTHKAPNGQTFRFNSNLYVYPSKTTGKGPTDAGLASGPFKFNIPTKGSVIGISRELIVVAFDDLGTYAAKPEEGKKMIKAGYVDLKDLGGIIDGFEIRGNVYVGFYPPK